MTSPHPTDSSETTPTQDLLYAARYYLAGRRGLIVLATAAIVVGLALNWSWLVAAGIAPLLLAVLPCLAMCALGLCMHRAGGKSCSTSAESAKAEQTAVTPDVPPVPRLAGKSRAERRARDTDADHG